MSAVEQAPTGIRGERLPSQYLAAKQREADCGAALEITLGNSVLCGRESWSFVHHDARGKPEFEPESVK
jgi:hypothetical protein